MKKIEFSNQATKVTKIMQYKIIKYVVKIVISFQSSLFKCTKGMKK